MELGSLLKVNIEDVVKKEPTMPAANYPCIIKQVGDGKSKEKKTPYVRVTVSISGWPEGIDPEVRAEVGSITGRTMYKDYWYSTEKRKWNKNLGKLCQDYGFSGDLELAVERLVGQRALAEVTHRVISMDRGGNPVEPYTVADINELIGVQG
jgi:hypothetical protein